MERFIKKDVLQNFKVLVDSREQMPYRFTNMVTKGLPAGDYSLAIEIDKKIISFEKVVAFERKRAVSELYSACGTERERFESELEKLSKVQCKAVICEFDFMDILNKIPEQTRIEPSAVYGSVFAWWVKYNVPFLFAGNRNNARASVWKLLQFFAKCQFLGER